MKLIVSDHYYLNEIRIDDVADIAVQLNDRWIHECTSSIPYPYTEQHAKEFVSKVTVANDEANGHSHFALRNSDDRLIGCMGFLGICRGHKTELGYWLGRDYRGKGIISAAIPVLCAYAFESWSLIKISAQVFSFNDASCKVLEKSGFVREGMLRCHIQKNGKFVDSIQYGLLRDEFAGKHSGTPGNFKTCIPN